MKLKNLNKYRILPIVPLIILLGLSLSYAQKGTESSKLSAIKAKIEKHRREIGEFDREIDVSFEQIEITDKKIEEIDETLREILQEIAAARGRMVVIENDLRVAENDLQKKQGDLKRHLRLIYKQGRYPMVRVLVSAQDSAEFARRVRYLALLAEEDQRLSRAIRRRKDEIEHDKALLREELDQLEELKQLNIEEREVQEKKRAQKRGMIADIKNKRKSLKARLKELEQEKKQLEALINKKTGGRTIHRKNPLKEHGKIDGPTKGTIIRPFGKVKDERYGTTTINDGIDIRAPLGRDVKSVLKGEVIFADWFKGYGKTIIVDHGSGLTTVYSHLGEILVAPGERVGEKQIIGSVGDTGYVDESLLHFEIRHNAEAINPQEWLKK